MELFYANLDLVVGVTLEQNIKHTKGVPIAIFTNAITVLYAWSIFQASNSDQKAYIEQR